MTRQVFFCAGQSVKFKNAADYTDKKTERFMAWVRIIEKKLHLQQMIKTSEC